MGGCNDTEVIRAVIDTSIWLGSIPGYAKGLVDMVMDEVAVVVGGGVTGRSFSPSTLRVTMANTSLVLAGQASRPQCQPGLKPTKKNIWISLLRN